MIQTDFYMKHFGSFCVHFLRVDEVSACVLLMLVRQNYQLAVRVVTLRVGCELGRQLRCDWMCAYCGELKSTCGDELEKLGSVELRKRTRTSLGRACS